MKAMRFSRALIPGRFQPFHKGHLKLVKWALERSDEIIIVVGSAQESHTLANPMTAGERIYIIKETLKDEGIDTSKVYIIPVPDILMNSTWVYHVKSYVPPFDVIISGNPLVITLFKEAGFNVIRPPMFDREKLVGTNIRRIMIEGGKWEEYLPKKTAELIKKFEVDKRLRMIMGTENFE